MLKDIVFMTDKIFTDVFSDRYKNDEMYFQSTKEYSKILYDANIKLEKVISKIRLVSDHYLTLDFTEEFLQNSSFGKPQDKWRYFLNEDLKELNESLKEYLFILRGVSGAWSDVALFNYKTYFSFVRGQYNVGTVNNSFTLESNVLNLHIKERSDISKILTYDLSTFENRVLLQNNLRVKNEQLSKYLSKLKEYILKNYTLEDLLK